MLIKNLYISSDVCIRIFSFFSDAGQFGGNQALAGVVHIIYSMTKKGLPKIFFITVGILGLYGMMISGTRGSIAVPLAGFMTFFVLYLTSILVCEQVDKRWFQTGQLFIM